MIVNVRRSPPLYRQRLFSNNYRHGVAINKVFRVLKMAAGWFGAWDGMSNPRSKINRGSQAKFLFGEGEGANSFGSDYPALKFLFNQKLVGRATLVLPL